MLKSQNSLIEWRSNSEGILIAFENSNSLSHFQQPALEAYKWAESISADKVVVVGLGSGFHVDALHTMRPECEIVVIECRPALIGFYQRKLKGIEILNVQDFESLKSSKRIRELLEAQFEKNVFKPALGAQRKFLEEVFWFLNLRTSESLEFFTGQNLDLPSEILINAKQLLENVEQTRIPYKKSEILTIQELMK